MYLISRSHHQVWDGHALHDEITFTAFAMVLGPKGVVLVPFTLKVVA